MRASRRRLNPLLLRAVTCSGLRLHHLALLAGCPYYTTLYELLRADRIPATTLNITRLESLADAVGFPRDDLFLDEAAR